MNLFGAFLLAGLLYGVQPAPAAQVIQPAARMADVDLRQMLGRQRKREHFPTPVAKDAAVRSLRRQQVTIDRTGTPGGSFADPFRAAAPATGGAFSAGVTPSVTPAFTPGPAPFSTFQAPGSFGGNTGEPGGGNAQQPPSN